MTRSSLAARLLLAFGFVALVSTSSVGLWIRAAIRRSEDERFQEQVAHTKTGLRLELQAERNAVQDMLHPLCAHDAFVDKTWIDLEARRLTPGRRVAIQQIVREETKALRLDELVLLQEDGTVLGAGKHLDWLGTKRPDLARLLRQPEKEFRPLRLHPMGEEQTAGAVVIGRCLTTRAGPRIGLVGERRLQPLLDRLAATYGVRVALAGGPGDQARPDEVSSTFRLDPDSHLRFIVFQSRTRLEHALSRLDRVLLITSLVTIAGSLLLALFLARSLTRPLARLASQVREAASHTPREVTVEGTLEIRTVAEAFNATMRELLEAQKRQAAMERIAAWREVARRVAHEIKNPLTPIRSSLETMRRLKQRRDPKFDEYFEKASRAMLDEVHRIATIASGFSKFARLPQPKLSAVDPVEVAQKVVAMHEASDVTVRLVASSVPLLRADRDQLAQVLTNLVHNAVDAVQEAHGKNPGAGRVHLVVSPGEADWVRIEVHDNGPGIDASVAENVFRPYFTTKQQGSGLGLAIVQRIVVEHGGEISVGKSSRLEGAVFSLRWPAARPATDHAPPSHHIPANS